MNDDLRVSPEVSVLIAAWNAEGTLGRAIQSVLDQQEVTFEIIVVDDASQDGTFQIAQSYSNKDDRVIALRNAKNAGPAVARNKGLARAHGRYVTVLDSDDFMEAERLARLVELANELKADFVADDLLRVDETNVDGPRRRLWSETNIGCEMLDFSSFLRGNLTNVNGSRGELGFLKPLMCRSFLEQHSVTYAEEMRLGEDYMLYARALAFGAKFYLTDPMGYVAVMRSDSLSGVHSTADLGALVAADLALRTEFQLSAEETIVLQQHLVDSQKRWYWMRLIDAVKSRNIKEVLACFWVNPSVVMFLFGQLGEQVVLRTARKFKVSRG